VEQALTKKELEVFNETWGIGSPPEKKGSLVLSRLKAFRSWNRENMKKMKKLLDF